MARMCCHTAGFIWVLLKLQEALCKDLFFVAVVSLVIMAVSHILDKMKIKNKSLVWGILSALILCRNLEFLIEIYRYAVLRFPV